MFRSRKKQVRKPSIVKPVLRTVVTNDGNSAILRKWECPNGYKKSSDGTYCIYIRNE